MCNVKLTVDGNEVVSSLISFSADALAIYRNFLCTD